MITKEQVHTWVKEFHWALYVQHGSCDKKMFIATGMPMYRVTHGREIVYEGPGMVQALEAYNIIKTVPNLATAPKLSN